MFIFDEIQIFLFGMMLMLLFSLWFFVNRKYNEYFSMAFLVSSITTLTYALLLDGKIITISASGNPVYFTRWLFYIASCSLLMLTITKVLKVRKENILPVIVLNGLVMLSGAISAATTSPLKWIIFGLGGLFFIAQLILIFDRIPAAKRNKMKKPVCCYIFFGWALFPLIFILSPEGADIISNFVAATLYLILDLVTKIIFYIHLSLSPRRKR
jgi:sensory rhodopsin